MKNEIVARSADWKQYCYAVGDFNPIHWDDSMAKSVGLEGVIAPGMFIASHIQGERDITNARIKFLGKIYDGDRLRIEFENGDYTFYRGDDVVCEVKDVKEGVYGVKVPEPFNEKDFLYRFSSSVNVGDFLESLGMNGRTDLYGMYLASLSGPTLLEFGKENGSVGGIHVSQSFTAYRGLSGKSVNVLVGNKKEKGPLHLYDLEWVDSGVVIASGKAMVLPQMI